MKKIERALISVSDKAGIVEFARALADRGVELLSTGGTAQVLRDADLPVKDISEFTGFPEMLDGRVKTLHPNVHAGLLFLRDNQDHVETMQTFELQAIDLVCVNLYPFEQTVARPEVTLADAIENIDIGGPAMLRSAAKNMRFVTVVCDPADYPAVIADLEANDGHTSETMRRGLAQKVFARVASYNAAIAGYLADQLEAEAAAAAAEEEIEAPAAAPRPFLLAYGAGEPLRYGENPHQDAVFYRNPVAPEACIAHCEVLHGKEMSFNNYVDGDAALEAVRELCHDTAAAIIKHTNPCGYATGETLEQAFEAAWAGDPVSAFGSVIAVTQPVNLATAEALRGRFVEVLIAPDYDRDALDVLTQKSKQIRLLKLRQPLGPAVKGKVYRQIQGGLLVQDRDIDLLAEWKSPTQRVFPEHKGKLAEFGVKACKHVKSNAIVLVWEYADGCFALLGMGAGQPNRVDSVRKLAVTKARENIALIYEERRPEGLSPEAFERQVLSEAVLVSDAFFPFPDNIEHAAEAGIRYVVEPGGSVRDVDVIAAADQREIAMLFTGMRHFRH